MVESQKNSKHSITPKNKQSIAEQANKACHLPANKNGPDLSKGGEPGVEGVSDLA